MFTAIICNKKKIGNKKLKQEKHMNNGCGSILLTDYPKISLHSSHASPSSLLPQD